MVKNQLPKFHETFIPILSILEDGKVIHYNELKKIVRDKYYSDLPEELLHKKVKSGDQLILNRIGWGKAYLKQAKMVEIPERGMVRITDKGRKVLENGELTLAQLKDDPDYKAYEIAKREKVKEDEALDESASPEDMIEAGVSQVEHKVRDELLDKLKSVDPFYFEKVVLLLLERMGYGDFEETSKSNDGGIDGIINQDQLGLEKIYVQAKRYNDNKVREKDIRNFIGAMSGDTSKGVFVTTSEFDDGAITKAREAHHKIILIDGINLVDYMYKFGVGVQVSTTYELKEVDEDFFDLG